MSDENVLGELSTVLDRLNGRLDSMEKGENPFAEMNEEKKPEKKPEKEEKDEGKEMAEEDKKEGMYAKSEYSDVITTDYLNWMENTLKSQGVDISGARHHFDQVSKANLGSTPEQIGDGAEYFAGQVKGRAQEGGSPSTNAIGKLNSNSGGSVAKGYLSPEEVSASDLEAAYEVYKAASREEQFKSNLGNVFADRLQKEMQAEQDMRAAQNFDARTPLANIEKALSDLSSRIDGIGSSSSGTELRKSISSVEIPSTAELGNMGWDEVHQLASSVFHNQ